jgi:hypothetical protein
MTFGYSSQLSDRSNLSGMGEWAHHLLISMSSVRQTLEVSFRISESAVILPAIEFNRSDADQLFSFAILWGDLLLDRYVNYLFPAVSSRCYSSSVPKPAKK